MTSHASRLGAGRRLFSTWLAFLAAATVEWGIALARAPSVAPLDGLTAWLLAASLWTLVATLWTAVAFAIGWLAVGRAMDAWLLEEVTHRIASAWAQRGTRHDRRRVAMTCALTGTAVAIGGVSIVWIGYLVRYRHGAVLIAVSAVLGQAVAVPVALLVAQTLRRGVLLALERMPTSLSRVLNAPSVWSAGLVGALGAAVVGLVVFWDVVLAVDGLALLFPAVAMALQPWVLGAVSRVRPRMPRRAAGALLATHPVVALALLFFASQPVGARGVVLRHAETSKFLFEGVSSLSDFDGDEASSFPLTQDCRPFDGNVSMYALEIPGNGIDENCDGKDDIQVINPRRDVDYRRPDTPPPNLILVTMDATRADHMGFMGYARDTTPNLDRLAREAVVFEKAFSQDSGTGPSLWSMMSGKTPFQVALREAHRFPPKIAPQEKLLAELLKEAGYSTQAVLCGSVFELSRWNIDRGFERYGNVCGHGSKGLAKKVTERGIAALERLRGNQPFFLWLHYYDPHGSYVGHPDLEQGFGKGKVDRYDEEIRYVDKHFVRFYRALQRQNGERPYYLAFTADHGEGFGEHGRDPHARTLYREVTHVPWLVLGSDLQPRRVDVPIAANDVYPTFLELARLDVPSESTMASQVPVLFGASPDPSRYVFQENSYSRPRRDVKAAIHGRFHYLMDLTTGVHELYDYVADPRERENLIGRGLPQEAALRQAVQRFLATTQTPEKL